MVFIGFVPLSFDDEYHNESKNIEKYSPIKILINAAIWHHYGKSQFLVREPSN